MSKENLEHNKDLKKITKGAGITLSGNLAGKALLFFYTLFLARVLGAEDIGLYFLGITVVRLFTIVSICGLDTGVVRYVAIYHGRNDPSRMKGTVLISAFICMIPSLILACLLFFSGEFVATTIFHKPSLESVISILAFGIPFEALMRIFLASTRGLKLMQYVAYTENIAWVGIRFLLAIIFVSLMGLGLKGVVLAYVLSSIVAAGMAFFYANKFIPLVRGKIKSIYETKELVQFSMPMVFTVLLYDLMSHVDILMLGLFVSSSDVGIYSIAVRIITLAQVVFMAFQPIFQPFIAELHDKNEHERLSSLLKVLTQWSLTISLPVLLALLFFPKIFLEIFGGEFVSGASCLSILVVAFAFSALSNLPASIIFMAGRSDLSLINNFTVLIINIIFNYFMIPKYGVIGAAVSTGLSYVILCCIRIVEVYYLTKIHPFKKQLWKPIMAALISAVIIFMWKSNNIVGNNSYLLITILPVFYSMLIYIFRLNEEDLYIKNTIYNKIKTFMK